ncbi:MAG: M48 family metalloprotease [Propionivibrio sp.]|uniref:M48 family metalloprotease n=1 Tax=Candidatus Propionivibrio dominans TaxID=2954373 RepID=A0A9D7F9N3_9RHOO|nr:M48 family metalloprotease [Candidatus Propionivibrio dominans]
MHESGSYENVFQVRIGSTDFQRKIIDDPRARDPGRTRPVGHQRACRGRGLRADLHREIRVSVIDARRVFAVTVPEGGGHRLFVSNFLIMTFTPEALRGVLAHEYGHMRQKHPAKQAVLLGLVAGVKMTAGIPLLAGLAILFLYLWMLREWEFIADSEALRLAGSESLKKAFHEYHVVSGDTVEASLFSEIFSGHPSFARRWARIAGR